MDENHAFDNSVITYPQTIENGKEDSAPKTTSPTFSGKDL